MGPEDRIMELREFGVKFLHLGVFLMGSDTPLVLESLAKLQKESTRFCVVDISGVFGIERELVGELTEMRRVARTQGVQIKFIIPESAPFAAHVTAKVSKMADPLDIYEDLQGAFFSMCKDVKAVSTALPGGLKAK